MQRKRQSRRDERARKDADRVKRRRRELADLLTRLGYVSAHPGLLDVLVERRYPEPEIVLTANAAERAAAGDIRAAVRGVLSEGTVRLAPKDVVVSLPVFFADYLMVADACRAEVREGGNAGPEWTQFARALVPHYHENVEGGLFAISSAIDDVLLPHCSFEGDIYFARYAFERSTSPNTERPRMTVTIDVHRAEAVTFAREGVPRPAWRCGLPFRDKGIAWARWSPRTPGFDRDLASADVYIQGHALHRLGERLCFSTSELTDWVWQSLRTPRLHPRGAGWLVEFRVSQWKLGYFVAEEVDGKILITTFLFLTNDGTPEGRRLRELTRFRTDQISWLKMDHLSYFLQSDVQHDGELRALFTECGCGHLFEMLKPEARVAALRMASDTRRHLDLPPIAGRTP